MPAIYAHRRLGEETVKGLDPRLQTLINTYLEAFILGTQGPDILFYYKPLKHNDTRRHGTAIHAESGERVFSALYGLWQTQGEKEDAFKSYLCGYLCHFTLDALCHKYIDDNSCEKLSHGKIESEFDKFILRKDGKPIRGFNTASPIKGVNGSKEACALAMGVDEKKIERSIKTMRKINKMFSCKAECFHAIAHAFLRLLKMERKFGDMFLHKKDDPLCDEINRVLYEKWQSGIPIATQIIEAFFLSDTPVSHELFRYNFSGII
ncbi:MAG: hypothetical protein E7381_02890 [Clostridiales bacterium]|nr:hypothetical protein [Clostridiales bacterium]